MTGADARADYWVELHHEDKRLGAGFALSRRFVLTALHCLRNLGELDDARLGVSLADGDPVEGRVCQRAEDADLALVEICGPEPLAVLEPATGPARPGDRWRSPYRPLPSDVELSGRVDGLGPYTCETGGSIEALQLRVDQHLGDYSGYSGGPVEGVADSRRPAVVGLLLEQTPSRALGSTHAANVLFAASIDEALRCFPGYFDALSLIDQVRPPAEPAAPRPPRNPKAAAESSFAALAQWTEQGLIDASLTVELQRAVALRFIDREFGDDEEACR